MPTPFLEEPVLSEAQRRRILDGVEHRGEFVLAENLFRIGADDPRVLESFRAHYGVLEVAPDPARPAAVEIVCALERQPEPLLTLLAGGRPYRVRGEEAVEHSFATLFHLMTLGIRTHHLVHAGCVSIRGRGIVIAAVSGMGKSTLSAHLAVRGADLLSDELAPLDRVSGLVVPAPFLVGIRPGAADSLVDGRETVSFAFREDRKRLVPVSSLSGREPPGAVRPHAIVFVTPRAGVSVTTLTKHEGAVMITFTAWTETFGAELDAVPGLRVLSRGSRDGHPFLMLEADDPERAMPALLLIARRHDIEIAGLQLEGHEGPDFAIDPVLARIPAAAGVLELVKKIFPLQMKELVRCEFGGRMAPLVQELAGLLRDTAFYKLTPGRLEAMLTRLEGLA